MEDHELDTSRHELLARVLQHGGVLAAPFGHAGDDSHEAGILADIDALEAAGYLSVDRDVAGAPRRITLSPQGYRVLGIG